MRGMSLRLLLVNRGGFAKDEERGKPDFDIQPVDIDGVMKHVSETVVLEKPFGGLRRFIRDDLPEELRKGVPTAYGEGGDYDNCDGAAHR